ncbi:MAG: hypothetical protein U0797_16100 [Gemmataceae bacterium]
MAKEVTVTANVPVAWASFNLRGTTEQFQVSGLKVGGRTARFLVTCPLQAATETMTNALILNARVTDTSPDLPGVLVSATLQIRASQAVDLTVMPKTIPVTFSGTEERGVARVLLQGKAITRGKDAIRSIRCEGFRVRWDARYEKDSNTAVVEIIFEPVRPAFGPRAEVWIDVQGRGSIRLPAVIARVDTTRE